MRDTAPAQDRAPPIDRVMPLLPQDTPARVMFGGQGLGVLTGDGFSIWRGGAEENMVLHAARGLGRVATGELLILDGPADASEQYCLWQVPGGGGVPVRSAPRALPIPGHVDVAVLPGKAGDDTALVTLSPPQVTWVRWTGQAGDIELVSVHERRGYGAPGVVRLPDGAVVYPWGEGLEWTRGDGTTGAVALPKEVHGVYLLANGRDGQVWATSRLGELWLMDVLPSPRVVWSAHLVPPPFHLAAAGDLVAVLLLDQRPEVAGATWSVALLEAGRGERWRVPIAAPKRAPETWVAVGADRVAVGGPAGVVFLDLLTGETVAGPTGGTQR